jgi:type II secretory pathway component GspD/PulD (secretin)
MRTCFVALVAATCMGLLFPACGYGQDYPREVPGGPSFSVLRLVTADAVRVATRLNAVLGGDGKTKIVADEPSNSILIRARAEKTRRARLIAGRLDVPSGLFVVALKNADANRAAEKVRMVLTLLRLMGDERDCRVTATGGTSTVIVCAAEEKANEVMAILCLFDLIGD